MDRPSLSRQLWQSPHRPRLGLVTPGWALGDVAQAGSGAHS